MAEAMHKFITRITKEGYDAKPAINFLNEWTGRFRNWERLERNKEMCSSYKQKQTLADLRKGLEGSHQTYATKAARQEELLLQSFGAAIKRVSWRAKRDEHLRKAAEYDRKIQESEAASEIAEEEFDALDNELDSITAHDKLVNEELALISQNISESLDEETRRDEEITEEKEFIKDCLHFFVTSPWLKGLCNLKIDD